MNEEKTTPDFESIPVPELTLDYSAAPAAPAPAPKAEPVADPLAQANLTPEEQQMVRTFAEKIDVTNSAMILQYGAGAQKKIASFSESALQQVRTKDMGEVGELLSGLVVDLKSFEVDEADRGTARGLFRRTSNRITSMKARYDKVEVNVDKVVDVLEAHQVQLLKDVAMLDKMYQLNLAYFKELTMYILAGKTKLEQFRKTELAAAVEKARKSGLPEDAQYANDLAAQADRFEKKLHDLELTRMVSIQMAPQIRLVQGNDTMMTEKIQSTIVNTIPLWKSQMLLALGLAHSQQAIEAERQVTELTNQLLRKNADALKLGTVAAARESERGVVDIETLKYSNQELISTLDEVIRIQTEGRQKRREAEAELGRLETELKTKLLDIRG